MRGRRRLLANGVTRGRAAAGLHRPSTRSQPVSAGIILTQAAQSELLAQQVSAPTACDGSKDPAADQGAPLTTPWLSIRRQARPIAVAAATCLAVLLTIEIAFFRSGFFATHLAISNPQTPLAKLALAERQRDTRVLYVGDSTMMTSVLPTVVSATCECGPGFNGGFSAANPWLTRAMTERLLGVMHPRLVVISVSPWTVDAHARFQDSDLDLARQLMSPAEMAALGASVDIEDRVDAALGSLWSGYGQRLLLKEWFSALAPGQRYDESLLGYWVAPGSANSYSRVVAATSRLFADVGEADPSAAGAAVVTSLVDDLRVHVMLVASYVFYASWSVPYAAMIFGLVVMNYVFGLILGRATQRRKAVLAAFIGVDLAVLAIFKYFDFGLSSLAGGTNWLLGSSWNPPLLRLVLPLGISFFTFEFIHYLVDISRGAVAVHSFSKFHVFAAFFPTQIAGPIKRFQDFVPSLVTLGRFDPALAREGLWLIGRGLGKKVLLADRLAPIATAGFSTASGGAMGTGEAWLTALAFWLQIYFDFSGYTDIARGSAALFGFRIPINFDAPYLATSLTDFWHRWHISLSTWLRDYVYIPLGGSRVTKPVVVRNLLITM